jgi:hypothetical protein
MTSKRGALMILYKNYPMINKTKLGNQMDMNESLIGKWVEVTLVNDKKWVGYLEEWMKRPSLLPMELNLVKRTSRAQSVPVKKLN